MTLEHTFGLPEALYGAAVAQLVVEDAVARAAALAALCDEHPDHAAGLRELAEELAGADRVLARSFSRPVAEDWPRIDGYRFVQVIGEGAFGVVYLCEQLAPVRRMVAIKVLRPGAGDRQTLLRFEAERQFLAQLNHPAIAQVFDAGLLAGGRPWFVMEHVAGAPITAFCDRAQLGVEARLELFAKLCHGVQHAHEHGIVHRDLKPANVLVIETDGLPRPKIIDFGIARALASTGGPGDARTETGRVVGTPGYMSPEQSAGRPDDVDARSDVFSLGVLLYELLTGELPWGKRPTSTDSEPLRPSHLVRASSSRSSTAAALRHSQPRRLASRLRGDLDWIVMKALAREQEGRYGTAAALAAEIQRHLRGEPVQAGPPSWGYRLRKFVRRRRNLLAAAAAIAAVVAIAVAVIVHYREQVNARDRDVEAATKSLLRRAEDPAVTAAPQSEVVRKALAQEALQLYDQHLRQHPDQPGSNDVRARSLCILAQVHLLIGRFGDAERLAQEVLTMAAPGGRSAEPDVARDVVGLAGLLRGRALHALGQVDVARRQLEEAHTILVASFQRDPDQNGERLVGVCRELVSLLDPADETELAFELLGEARAAQQRLAEMAPRSVTQVGGLVELDVMRALLYVRLEDLAAAQAALDPCQRAIATRTDLPIGTVVRVHYATLQVCTLADDVEAAVGAAESAVDAARTWVEREPNREQPLRLLSQMLAQQAALHGVLGRSDAGIVNGRAAVAAGEARLLHGDPDKDAMPDLVASLVDLARVLLAEETAVAWAEAEQRARRAVSVCRDVAAAADARERWAWLASGCLATVVDERGGDGVAALWVDAERALQTWRAGHEVGADSALQFGLVVAGIARHRLAVDSPAGLPALLDAALVAIARSDSGTLPIADLHAELLRLAAESAARLGDLPGAITAAERTARVAQGWRGKCAAARAIDIVRRTAGVADAASHLAVAIERHERAIAAMIEALAAGAPKPSLSASLAQTRLRLALLRRDRGEAVDLARVSTDVATLTELRGPPRHFDWDQDLFDRGAALVAK